MDTPSSPSNISVKAPLIAGISFLLGVFFDYFFYEKIPGIGFPIYILLVLVGLFIISTYSKKQISKQVVWLLMPLMFFSSMVFVRSSALLTFLNVVSSLLLLLLIAEVSFTKLLKNFLGCDYLKIVFVPFKFIVPFFETIPNIFKFNTTGTRSKISGQVIKGIIMTIPVLLIFLVLFSSADLIFQKYLLSLIPTHLDPEIASRFILVLCVTFIFIGAYAYIFGKKEDSGTLPAAGDAARTVGHIETSILLSAVNALFFTFILVQLTYLFGGEGSIAAQGFTYAEYARKGFFELIAVAIVSFILLLATEKYTAKNGTGHALIFKILSAMLILQVILIMGSAFTRLLIYEEAYGFTTLRLYSHGFILLLAVIFLSLLYKIFRDARENAFAFRIFISVMVSLAVMNILNPDAFIAKRNIERFAATGTLDIHYLSSLSDDAVPETVNILNISNEDLRKSFARELYWRTQKDPSFSPRWQSLNISRMQADAILRLKMADLEQYKDYQLDTSQQMNQ